MFFGQNEKVLWEHIFEFVFLGIKMRYKNLNFWNVRKSRFLRTTSMKVKILSDRTSSFSIFFERTYFFCNKTLTNKEFFLEAFLFEKRTFGFKAPPFHEYLLYQKKIFRHVAKLLNTPRYCLAFFPTSNCLRKPWKTCSKLSDWLISKAPYSAIASRCPPGRVQMLSIL